MSLAAALERPAPVEADCRKRHVIQGEFHVTDEPDLMLTTILGSCVAACLRDPAAGVGGMNHFLLPGEPGADGLRYGVQSMELLINGLLRMGARRERMEARLFGGARLIDGLTDVGLQNAAFAERFLRDEGVRFVGGSLRGDHARRVQFWPVAGRARQSLLARAESSEIFATPSTRKPTSSPKSRRTSCNAIRCSATPPNNRPAAMEAMSNRKSTRMAATSGKFSGTSPGDAPVSDPASHPAISGTGMGRVCNSM